MYIETALKRLNAFNGRSAERFSFPTSYGLEPYRLYSWGDVLALVAALPHTSGDDCAAIKVPGLEITLIPSERTIVEERQGYILHSKFEAVGGMVPNFRLYGPGHRLVYSRVAEGIEYRKLDCRVVSGKVTEEWHFPGDGSYHPTDIRQEYQLYGDDGFAGWADTTYRVGFSTVIESGQIVYDRFLEHHKYTPREYKVLAGQSKLLLRKTYSALGGDATTYLFGAGGKLRKTYFGESGGHRWYDGKDREIRKGLFNFITHSYEVAIGKAKDSMRQNGSDRYDKPYLSVESTFGLERCPEFPVPAKDKTNV